MTTLDPSPCSPQYWNDAILSYCLKKRNNKTKELDSSSWLSQKASVYKDDKLLKEPRLHFTKTKKQTYNKVVSLFFSSPDTKNWNNIWNNLFNLWHYMFHWCQVKPFENLWIINLYKFGLYSWNFCCKIEPCSLPVENGPAKCGLQCEAVEDPHLAPHHHTTCRLFASFDLEFAGRKGKLVWRLKRTQNYCM